MRNPLASPTTEFAADPESAVRLRRLFTNAIASMIRAGINHSDAARIQWQTAAQRYRERWAQGDLDAIVPVLPDMVAWLRAAGIDPAGNADVVALFNDPAVQSIRRRIRSIDSDRNLVETFRQLAGAITK